MGALKQKTMIQKAAELVNVETLVFQHLELLLSFKGIRELIEEEVTAEFCETGLERTDLGSSRVTSLDRHAYKPLGQATSVFLLHIGS